MVILLGLQMELVLVELDKYFYITNFSMKYTILEIMPGQLRVEYEDKSWAYIPISPSASLEDIDDAASRFDPEFLPKPEDITPLNIFVGEIRESKRKDNILFEPSPPNSIDIFSNLNIILSKYFSQNGDNRLEVLINDKIAEYIQKYNITPDKIIDDIMYNPEDIMAQAEEELNAEQ
jgi:hypothetical protein